MFYRKYEDLELDIRQENGKAASLAANHSNNRFNNWYPLDHHLEFILLCRIARHLSSPHHKQRQPHPKHPQLH